MSEALAHSANEMITVAAARLLNGNQVCFVGIGLPSAAANLARLTRAPGLVLIYESGTIGTKPTLLPLSIGDGDLAEHAATVVSVPEIFTYWLQAGRVDVGFLGAAQIDRFANLNTTVIGPYEAPRVRLPGAGGAPEIASAAKETFLVIEHSPRTLVDKLDLITTAGYLNGFEERRQSGARGAGPTVVITDMGILRPDVSTKELMLTHVRPGVSVDDVRSATGWPLKVTAKVYESEAPTVVELETLRTLQARTKAAHATVRGTS